ncbi:lyase family protein [Enterobacter sp. RHBSTW-01064]|uniref:lyase family protein n=1 Tax=Enterobacter sp. RHBSTW-01064 TaxID=2742679 RepID=UPI0031F8C5DC
MTRRLSIRKMHMRSTIREIQQDIVHLQKVIVSKAENNINAIMPGYTHLQTGQPILLSHWIMAYYWMLRRDWTRFADLYQRMGNAL